MKNIGNTDEIIQNQMTPYRAYFKTPKILLGKSRAKQNHVKHSEAKQYKPLKPKKIQSKKREDSGDKKKTEPADLKQILKN